MPMGEAPKLAHGAFWLTQEGALIPVAGFHEAWIASHPELVGDCRNVSDVVLKLGWISVAVFSEGYVELLVPGRRDPAILDRVEHLLRGNRGLWKTALVMSMDEEGYARLKDEDLASPERLRAILEG